MLACRASKVISNGPDKYSLIPDRCFHLCPLSLLLFNGYWPWWPAYESDSCMALWYRVTTSVLLLLCCQYLKDTITMLLLAGWNKHDSISASI